MTTTTMGRSGLEASRIAFGTWQLGGGWNQFDEDANWVSISSTPPTDTETRVGDFADLVATAIANADARAQLTASRARIVAASDAARRRFERNLHDGAQQRLVSLGLQLRTAEASLPPEWHSSGEAF